MEIFIFDEITETTAREVTQKLADHSRQPFTVRINSPGGSVLPAIAITNALRSHGGRITIAIEGLCASAAVLLCTASHTRMASNALMMIHGPYCGLPIGDATDFREVADLLDKITGQIIEMYVHKTRRSIQEIEALMKRDHWYTANEAFDLGFVDEISRPLPVAARLGNLTPPKGLSLMNAAPETLSPEAIELHCLRAEEPLVLKALSGQAVTELDLKDRIERAKTVRKVCARAHLSDLADGLIMQGADEEVAKRATWEALVQRDERAPVDNAPPTISNPIAYGGYGENHFMSSARDALALRQGAPLQNPHPAARDLANASLIDLATLCLQQSGRRPHIMTRTVDGLIKAAMTTSDLPNLLAAGVERAIQTWFEDLADYHRRLVTMRPLKNFKPATSINVSGFPSLELKPEAVEITYGSISDRAETIQLKTFARGLAVTREMLINDDLSGLSSLNQIAANAAVRLERDLVFSVLTSNPTMSDSVALFHADRGNLISTANPLGITTLNAARQKMRAQKDSSGGYVLTQPRFLIVSTLQEGTGEALVASMTYRPASDTEIDTPKWVKGLEIIADPRLDESDAEDWYLLSRPQTAPVIELGTLNEQKSPTVETEQDFDRDILKLKCRYDVGVSAVGWAGVVKTVFTG